MRTEAEAITLALEEVEVVRRQRFIEGIEALARLGPIHASLVD